MIDSVVVWWLTLGIYSFMFPVLSTCAPGTFKSAVRSASCSLCVANTYSTAVQATNVSTCLACPNNSVSVPGRFECECNFGYEGDMRSGLRVEFVRTFRASTASGMLSMTSAGRVAPRSRARVLHSRTGRSRPARRWTGRSTRARARSWASRSTKTSRGRVGVPGRR